MLTRSMNQPLVSQPIIIAHRGVSGLRLEHTRPSYELAIEQGADFIEPDVVSSKDGVLVVRHENEISGTTDVADRPEFAGRRSTKTIDGAEFTGWFTEDFTVAELKKLRTRERIADLRPHNIPLAGQQQILTFDEVLDIAEEANRDRETPVGVYVETKHPSYFAGIGLDLNDQLIECLERRGVNHTEAPVIIQSMESANLRRIREHTPLVIIQLMVANKAPHDFVLAKDGRTYDDLATAKGLAFVAEYADGIGPNKDMVIGRDRRSRLTGDTGLVRRAHDAGLLVHIWTMRNENTFLPADFKVGKDKAAEGDAVAEYLAFFDVGVDGVFSDYTATAFEARELWLAKRD